MLGLQPFRHDLLRKYEMVFGALFNEIHVTRRDEAGEVQRLRVPLTYAPKEKILARVHADPKIDRQAAAVLPRMSFELTTMVYNGDNKLRSIRNYHTREEADSNERISFLNPVPYDLKFTLWIFTKNVEDGNQIIEQIVPYFTPHFTPSVNLIEGITLDCPVRLDGCEPRDVYDGAFAERRAVMWTLNFTMTAYLFGPERKQPVIKFADVGFYDATTYDDISDSVGAARKIDRVTVQPGLTANGEPTTDPELSVHYSEISESDDWDYAITIYGYVPSEPAD